MGGGQDRWSELTTDQLLSGLLSEEEGAGNGGGHCVLLDHSDRSHPRTEGGTYQDGSLFPVVFPSFFGDSF